LAPLVPGAAMRRISRCIAHRLLEKALESCTRASVIESEFIPVGDSAPAAVMRLTFGQGSTRSGLPDPCWILSGGVMIIARWGQQIEVGQALQPIAPAPCMRLYRDTAVADERLPRPCRSPRCRSHHITRLDHKRTTRHPGPGVCWRSRRSSGSRPDRCACSNRCASAPKRRRGSCRAALPTPGHGARPAENPHRPQPPSHSRSHMQER